MTGIFSDGEASINAGIARAADHMDTRRENNRAPTYDSFGDTDEAMAWVLERVSWNYNPDAVKIWWTGPNVFLEEKSPETVWDEDPNRVIRLAHQLDYN